MGKVSSAVKASIGRAVGRYAEGLRKGEVKTLKQVFRPEAIVSGYIGKDLFDAKPVQDLYDYVENNASPAKRGDPFRYTIRSIDVAGKTATVRIREYAYLGDNYETSLHLTKIDGRWWIVSKLFSGTAVA